jgi:PLP dependent protein
MLINQEAHRTILTELAPYQATLVAVSKTKPKEAILDMYQLGQRDFGENYVQELVDKAAALPKDIRWHFIGHLQSNKVKYIAPFVYLIHGVDSLRLLLEIQKQALKQNRVVDVLLQMHIASEDTKFGLDERELKDLLEKVAEQPLSAVRIRGLMGMASFTDDPEKVRTEFRQLKRTFDGVKGQTPDPTLFTLLSMGMSSDYPIAIQEGSNLVRIGSLLFGAR